MSDDGIEVTTYRVLLETRRDELLSIAESGESAAAVVELDQSRMGRVSRMDAMQIQAVAQEAERRRRLELQRIASALARMEEGEYGYCLRCGETIAEGRLQADPATTLCITCADAAER